MRKIIKKLLFTSLAYTAMLAVAAGMEPASFILWYQPKPPVE